MSKKPTAKSKHYVTLTGDNATGNHAIDSYAYGPFPHLFTRLAVEYRPPADMLLTLLFLWDRTVGRDELRDDAMGDIALSQIPVQPRCKLRWLEAFVAAGFWERTTAARGGKQHKGSVYVYKNPTTEEWDKFFEAAAMAQHFDWNVETVPPKRWARLFAHIRDNQPGIEDDVVPPTPEERADALERIKRMGAQRLLRG